MSLFPFSRLADGITLLSGHASGDPVRDAVLALLEAWPPRRLTTPWGKQMSVAMTNAGTLGWTSDEAGYRYTERDPLTGLDWPALPPVLRDLAVDAAAQAGFPNFDPQACLINLYESAAHMGLHQDRDEQDLTQPVVSLSLGRSARFRFGGLRRRDPTQAVTLHDGDSLIFGGPARLMFHGVDRLEGPPCAKLGDRRINLTFRHVGSTAGVSA
jgi:alkylated DNA repair protein (DNA oxidative demethylase)